MGEVREPPPIFWAVLLAVGALTLWAAFTFLKP